MLTSAHGRILKFSAVSERILEFLQVDTHLQTFSKVSTCSLVIYSHMWQSCNSVRYLREYLTTLYSDYSVRMSVHIWKHTHYISKDISVHVKRIFLFSIFPIFLSGTLFFETIHEPLSLKDISVHLQRAHMGTLFADMIKSLHVWLFHIRTSKFLNSV